MLDRVPCQTTAGRRLEPRPRCTISPRFASLSLAALSLSVIGLAACGGSGGGGSTPGIGAPENLAFQSGEVVVFASQDLAPLVPTVEGAVDSYSVMPALPLGLTLDPLSGTIQGRPVTAAPRRLYDVRATNAGGSAHALVGLTVVAPPRFAYVTSSVDDSIAVFATDFASGALTRHGVAAPAGADHEIEDLVVHPSGRFAYATCAVQDTLVWFELATDSGRIVERGALPLGPGPHGIAIHPAGRWLWVTNQAEDRIRTIELDATTGEPSETAPAIPTGTEPSAIVVDALGAYAIVASRGDDDTGLGSSILLYDVNVETGALTSNGLPFRLNGGQPTSLAIDPTKDLVFVALDAFDDVLPVHFDRTNGHMNHAGRRDTGINPGGLAVEPHGRFAYLVNRDSDTISAFRIAESGSLTLVQTIDGGAHPMSITLDPAGRFAYVAAADRGQLLRFALDGVSGQLTPIDVLETRAGTVRIAFSQGDEPLGWDARFVHVANEGSDDLSAFSIDDATGALTAQPAAAAGAAPVAMAVSTELGIAWAASRGAHTVESFRIDAATGALTSLSHALALDDEPNALVLGPTGRFLYVVTTDGSGLLPGTLHTCSIDDSEGSLTVVQADPVGFDPRSVVIDPLGTFVYVTNRGDGSPSSESVSVFALPLKSGRPTAAPVGSIALVPGSIAFAPSGRFAYGMLEETDGIALFAVDRASGQLDLVPAAIVPGEQPRSVAFTPDGRFAYAAFEETAGAGAVAVYAVAADGLLGAPIQLLPNLAHPRDLALEDSGRFLYVASRGADVVATAAVDRATGMLTLGIPVSSGVQPASLLATSTTH